MHDSRVSSFQIYKQINATTHQFHDDDIMHVLIMPVLLLVE